MGMKSQNILILILAFTLIVITIIIVYINHLNKQAAHDAAKQIFQEVYPTAIPKQPQTYSNYQVPVDAQPPADEDNLAHTQPMVKLDEQAAKSSFNKVLNRHGLSDADKAIKTKTLENLLPEDATSGTLYTTANISIDYTYGNTDAWEVTILTTNIDPAKEEAAKWFLDQGFSQDFICNYPVEFYLSGEVQQKLSGSNIVFNPLAPGCQ